MDELKKYIGCDAHKNLAQCWITKYIPLTWSFISIITLILTMIFNVNKKIQFFIVSLVILNSIIGSLMIHVFFKDKIRKYFKLKPIFILLYDLILHILVLFAILFYYNPPTITNKELLIGVTIVSIIFYIYQQIIDVGLLYFSLMPDNVSINQTYCKISYIIVYAILLSAYRKNV